MSLLNDPCWDFRKPGKYKPDYPAQLSCMTYLSKINVSKKDRNPVNKKMEEFLL